jgi:hypothetical protein
MIDATFRIPLDALDGLKGRIAEANKKAARLDVEPLTLTVGETDTVEKFVGGVPTGQVLVFVNGTITGTTPRLNGWAFIASLELFEDTAIIRSIPGEECPPEHRNRGSICDHCGYNRRRTSTYVVRHDDGTVKTVGRNCLKDFMGQSRHNPASIALMFQHIAELLESLEAGEAYGGGGRGGKTYDLKGTLELTSAVISAYGWVSKTMVDEGKAYGDTTADLVREYLTSAKPSTDLVAKVRAAKDAKRDTGDAEAAIAWLTDDDLDVSGDYIQSVQAIAKRGWVGTKHMGFACSIIPAWRNMVARLAKVNTDSQHMGTIGKRETFTLKVNRLIWSEGFYGVTIIHLMEDADGNVFKWFSSGPELDEGEFLTLKATVKDHGEYQGTKETVLTRVKAA